MKLKYRNIISFHLLLLIFFSTIGFNIISTFCDGCESESTSIAITNSEQDLSCECCSVDTHEMTCCQSDNNHDDEHHQTTSIFAKLKFDSPEARTKTFVAETPVFLLHFFSILFDFEFNKTETQFFSNINLSPPRAGRTLLTLICILRN